MKPQHFFYHFDAYDTACEDPQSSSSQQWKIKGGDGFHDGGISAHQQQNQRTGKSRKDHGDTAYCACKEKPEAELRTDSSEFGNGVIGGGVGVRKSEKYHYAQTYGEENPVAFVELIAAGPPVYCWKASYNKTYETEVQHNGICFHSLYDHIAKHEYSQNGSDG